MCDQNEKPGHKIFIGTENEQNRAGIGAGRAQNSGIRGGLRVKILKIPGFGPGPGSRGFFKNTFKWLNIFFISIKWYNSGEPGWNSPGPARCRPLEPGQQIWLQVTKFRLYRSRIPVCPEKVQLSPDGNPVLMTVAKRQNWKLYG